MENQTFQFYKQVPEAAMQESENPTRMPQNIAFFPKTNKPYICDVCGGHHISYCVACTEIMPICKKCKGCNQPRKYVCTLTQCYKEDDWKDIDCKYCRTYEKQTEFEDRPPRNCIEGSFTMIKKYNDYCLSADERALIKEKQKHCGPCPECKKTMPILKKCYICYANIYLNCADNVKCIQTRELQTKINPMWFCDRCQIRRQLIPYDAETICFSCDKAQPVKITCQKCKAKSKMFCSFPYICTLTRKPKRNELLCEGCDAAGTHGFEVITESMCVQAKEEVQMTEFKSEESIVFFP